MKLLHNYSKRIQKLQNLLKNKNLDGMYLVHPLAILYFTGLNLSTGRLLISPTHLAIFVDSRYREYVENSTHFFVAPLNSPLLKKTLATWKEIGIEGYDMSYAEVLDLKKIIPKRSHLHSVAFSKQLRSIKEESEIQYLQASASLLWKGFLSVQGMLQPGITEKEVENLFRKFCIDHNAKEAFDPIIAFGANGSKPHHKSSNKKLENNTLILIDIGLDLNSYASDMTRMVFFGNVDPKWHHLHKLVEKAKQAALDQCCAGRVIRDLDLTARKIFKQENVEEYFVHGLGHGVGLDVHEWPSIHSKGPFANTTLEENMVITIEPGLYFPGKGGIRIEDTIQITRDGYENFFPQS